MIIINKTSNRPEREYVTVYIELNLLQEFERVLQEQDIKSRSSAICQLIEQYVISCKPVI